MKVPEPKKQPSGKWFIQLRLNGVSIPVTADTKTECVKQAQLIKAEHLAGKRKVAKVDITVGEVLDQFIEKYEDTLSPSTIRGYNSVRKNRFQSVMDTRVNLIKDWQSVINKELETKSEHTVKNGWGVISAAFNDAGIPLPRIKLRPVPVHELPFLEPEEIKPFLDAIVGDPAEIYILLELHSLRESEAMAVVKNNSFDLKHNTIIVSGSIVPNKEHKFVSKETNKTKKSTREIPIMIPRLKELLEAKEGEPFEELSPLTILKHVHAACQKAGVTDVTNHGLRRTFASLGYSLNVSERIIMDIGGWENPTTVHKVYIKLSARDKNKSKNSFTSFFSFGEEQIDKKALDELADFKKKYDGKLSHAFKKIMGDIDKLQERFANENANGKKKV